MVYVQLKILFPFVTDPLLLVISTQWYCYFCPNHRRGPTRCLVAVFNAMTYWLATYQDFIWATVNNCGSSLIRWYILRWLSQFQRDALRGGDDYLQVSSKLENWRIRSYSSPIWVFALELVTSTTRLQQYSDFRGSRIPLPPIPSLPSSHPVILLHRVKLYFYSSFDRRTWILLC